MSAEPIWEYHASSLNDDIIAFEKRMNALARDGWELVSAATAPFVVSEHHGQWQQITHIQYTGFWRRRVSRAP